MRGRKKVVMKEAVLALIKTGNIEYLALIKEEQITEAIHNDNGSLWSDICDLANEMEIKREHYENDVDFGIRVIKETDAVLCKTSDNTWGLFDEGTVLTD